VAKLRSCCEPRVHGLATLTLVRPIIHSFVPSFIIFQLPVFANMCYLRAKLSPVSVSLSLWHREAVLWCSTCCVRFRESSDSINQQINVSDCGNVAVSCVVSVNGAWQHSPGAFSLFWTTLSCHWFCEIVALKLLWENCARPTRLPPFDKVESQWLTVHTQFIHDFPFNTSSIFSFSLYSSLVRLTHSVDYFCTELLIDEWVNSNDTLPHT
jgi:hypothetical protein